MTYSVSILTVSNKISNSFESLDSSRSSRSTDITSVVNNNNDYDHRFNSIEIDLFDLLYNDKLIAIDNSIELIDKDIYICNVHLFIDRIENITRIRDSELICNNLYTCFREIIM